MPIDRSAGNPYAQLDQTRRLLGKRLDTLGLGPLEIPSRVVFTKPGITLKSYGENGSDKPLLLIIPAPIKRAYIWDLAPGASVVQQCMQHGLRVYLIQWEQPGADEQEFGLADYADRLILDCIDAIEAESDQGRCCLAGHSLGGTLSAIFSALHPERVQSLVLLGAPLHFGQAVGALDSLVAITPGPQHRLLTTLLGNIPGSFLNTVSLLASPVTFGWSRWQDWLNSLPDAQALQTHLRVERWTLDEMPLARRFFAEVVELLYREDRFMRGILTLSGKQIAPKHVIAPLLSVIYRPCAIVPPEAVLPFHRAAGSTNTKTLWYEGDTGVSIQHVGMLVGKNAHHHLWPQIIRWLKETCA
jgi:polyhydroxyalkanoate synthase